MTVYTSSHKAKKHLISEKQEIIDEVSPQLGVSRALLDR
jgi:hypothetical protein